MSTASCDEQERKRYARPACCNETPVALDGRVFRKSTWEYATVLLVGAILAPAKRTVISALSVMGLRQETHFQTYHRFLHCATWLCLARSRIRLTLRLTAFVPADAPSSSDWRDD